MGLRSVTLYVRPLNRFESCFASARACSIASLQDVAPVSSIDVGANYFLSMAQLGCPRARASLGGLAALNPCVTVSVLEEPALTEEVLRRFHVVVFTGTPRSELFRWSDFLHAQVSASQSMGEGMAVGPCPPCEHHRRHVSAL